MEKKYRKPIIKAIVIEEDLLTDFSYFERNASSRVRATEFAGADIQSGETVQGDAKGNNDFDW